MAMGGPEGPQSNGGGWFGIGNLTSAVAGWFGGKATEAAEGESYIVSAGARRHKSIDTRSVTDAGEMKYPDFKVKLLATLQTCREETDDPDKFDQIRKGALDVCLTCLERDNLDELTRHMRNFGTLFEGFPDDLLMAKWREHQGIEAPAEGEPVEEAWNEFESHRAMRNLAELKAEFDYLYNDFKRDTEEIVEDGKKFVENRPNTKVLSTNLAMKYLAEGDLGRFIDLYHNSHWLFSTLPLNFIEAIEKTSSNNTTLDQHIKKARKPLRKDYLFQSKRLPLGCAAMMQQGEQTLMSIKASCVQELEAARTHGSQGRETSALRALEALKNGHWHDLKIAIADNSALKRQWQETAEDLGKQENFGYLGMIAKARILESYKKSLTEGTSQQFLYDCRPDSYDEDHWTCMLEREEYDIEDAVVIDLKDRRQKQREKVEAALEKYMPELDDSHPLEVKTRKFQVYDPSKDLEV